MRSKFSFNCCISNFEAISVLKLARVLKVSGVSYNFYNIKNEKSLIIHRRVSDVVISFKYAKYVICTNFQEIA